MAALGAAICNALSRWVEAERQYPSPMGLDDRRQATGRDSGECPKTVTYIFEKSKCSLDLLITTELHTIVY